MPWGTSLNKDVDDCVARLVAVGYGLNEGDLGYSTRFSRHTLREQTSAYKRVMDPALGMEKGAPTSKIYENSFLHSPEFVTRAASPFKSLGLGRVTVQPP
jgi:hypothetical protein